MDLKNVKVSDPKISLKKPTGDDNDSEVLNPGETWVQTGIYELTSDDITNGDYIENTATVNCNELQEKSSSVDTSIDKRTDLSIYTSVIGMDDVGDKIINKPGDVIKIPSCCEK